MGLTALIDSAKRRTRRIAPVKRPPELKLNVLSEFEFKYSCPIKNPKDHKQSPWELNLIIEEKRPLIIKDQANSLDASRFSLSSTCK